MRRAVYPGSFNPVHLGHMHIILQASRLFDEVRVLIAVNPEKTYKVSAEDRRAILENLVGTLPCHNVSVGVSERSSKDEYQKERYEALMAGLNKGRSISATDYRFLKRYCKEHVIALPDMELHLYARLKQ